MKTVKIPDAFAPLVAVLLFFPSWLNAEENRDSLALVEAEWNEEQIANNITLKQAFFKGTLFSSNQVITILEINVEKSGKKGSPHFSIEGVDELTKTSEIAANSGALAGVNGNFFSFKKPHNSVDYLRVNGIEICGNNGKGKRGFNQSGVVAVDKKGRLSIYKPDSTDMAWERTLDAPNIMTAGPLLISRGEKEPLKRASFYITRHPRTAVAILDNKKVLLITVDGRNGSAQGMSLEELQKSASWLGAKELINLDGGGSTTMYIEGKGVVNYPSDNKKFDHFGERRVANALLLRLNE